MPLAGTSPLSRARAHYMWAKRYNDENNLPKSIAHLDRAMAYGTSPQRSRSPDKGVVYARDKSGFFYHVTKNSIGVYDKRHLGQMYSVYVIQSYEPHATISLAIRPNHTGGGSVTWPEIPSGPRVDAYRAFENRADEIEVDVWSICETKLKWNKIFLSEWPKSDDDADKDEDKGRWIAYDDVRTCVSDLYEQERRRKRKKGMCFVCLNRPTEVACLPCGHKCFCERDAPNVTKALKCPACGEPVASLARIFEN
jgi:hypothetical protein